MRGAPKFFAATIARGKEKNTASKEPRVAIYSVVQVALANPAK